VGLSWALPDGTKKYLSWGHPTGNNCTVEQVRAWAKDNLTRRGLRKIFFNGPFDMRMMAYEGIPVRYNIEDGSILAPLLNELDESMSLEFQLQKYCGMGKNDEELNKYCALHFGGAPTRDAQAENYHRAPGHIVAPYASDDAWGTLVFYDKRRPQINTEELDDIYQVETQLLPILLKMHLLGVRVDVAKTYQTQQGFQQEEERVMEQWYSLIGYDVNVDSPKQMAALFDKLGIAYPKTDTFINKKGKESGGNPSFPADWLKRLPHPVAKLVLARRKLGHYTGTFLENYILKNVDPDGVIHGEFHQMRNERYGTVSGRFSSGGGLNLQNVPARDEEMAPLIRGLFIPMDPDNQDWLKIDYSQIEYRFLAHYAGGILRKAYNENPDQDFHRMASLLTGLQRPDAKTFNFAVIYGQGVAATAEQLGCSMEEAKEKLKTYHTRLPEIQPLYDKAMRRAKKRGYILTWGGRKRRFMPREEALARGWNLKRDKSAYIGGHKALNGLLQGSAADLIKKAMVRVGNEIDWVTTQLHLTVHDELDLSIPKGPDGVREAKRLKEMMEDYQLTVPIIAEAEKGPDWGHVGEIDYAAAA
jgi:DNA polymerase-1